MAVDVDRVRAETPGCEHANHLLACGSALMPSPVVGAVQNHLELEALISGYEAAAERAEQLDGVYDSVADLIGADSNEIALLENATAAWCQAFYSVAMRPGDRILTCDAEYGANYVAMLQRARRDGIRIEVVPSDHTGALDVDALGSMIDDRVVLISLTWLPTNGGLVNPAEEVGRIASEHGIFYLLDACQAVGQMPVDVGRLQCDALSATGRKFLRGPRGTGFLYVAAPRIATMEPVVIDHFAAEWVRRDEYRLRDDARRFENWESSYALRAGLGAAVDYAIAIGLDQIQERSWGLARRLRDGLAAIPGVRVTDLGESRSAIVSFTIEGHDPGATVAALRERRIIIGSSDASSTRLDAERRSLPTVLRAAPHYYNTEREVDDLADALDELRAAPTAP